MYEGWHIEFTRHALARMEERLIERDAVLEVVRNPDSVRQDVVHGGKLLSIYRPDWDRILVVAVVERSETSVLIVKTVLWSAAN